ncbi:MAG: hypothetical protein GXO33_02820 [Epsilonproteobacteria bacterium]|nr:hypothetical protein [Campylobacterota bacterium]
MRAVTATVMAAVWVWGGVTGRYLPEGDPQKALVMGLEPGGTLTMLGAPVGTWRCAAACREIFIASPLEGKGEKRYRVFRNDGRYLGLEREGEKHLYRRLDTKDLPKRNAVSGLEGRWRLTPERGVTLKIEFVLPDVFRYERRESREESLEKGEGEWYYDPKTRRLIVSAFGSELAGESTVRVEKNRAVFKKRERVLEAEREK